MLFRSQVTQYPANLRTTSKGKTAHFAKIKSIAMEGPPLDCCPRERYSYALYNRFKVPKLYKFALNGDWDMIPQRCKSNPREAQFVHFYPPSDTTLHRILRTSTECLDVDSETKKDIQQLKLNAISALLAAYPMATSIRDTFGRTPLHIACMEIHSSTVAAKSSAEASGGDGDEAAIAVLYAYPKASAVQDLEGRTPLHYLVGRNDVIPLNLLSKLIDVFPKALIMEDNVMQTPLQIVHQRGNEIYEADVVVEMLKAAEEEQNSRGDDATMEDQSCSTETTTQSTIRDRSSSGSCPREQSKEGNRRARTV